MLYDGLLPPRGQAPEFVRTTQLAAWLDVDPKTLYRWADEGRLPKPIKLGQRIRVWRVEDVRQALANLQERDFASIQK